MKPVSLQIPLLALISLAVFASAQNTHFPLPPAVPQSQDLTVGSRPIVPSAGADDEVQKQQAAAANLQRQADIRRDALKIADLTRELNDYLAKTEQGVMSVEAIKKADQIEKLAHSVKSRMKQTF